MKRTWLGVGILAVFLVLGLWSSHSLSQSQAPLCQTLEQAAAAAMGGDMEAGAALAAQAKDTWQTNWHWVAALADHAPMDEIDALFARLEAFRAASAATDFAAHCLQLSQLIEATAEAHRLTWWNAL